MTTTNTTTPANRRPLKWTATEPEGWHVYTFTGDCGCQIDATRFAANHFVMSNSAGFYETFESYQGLQNEAALMIDNDSYHQFGWTLPDGTVMQPACQHHPDGDDGTAGDGSHAVVAELIETARDDGDTFIWQLAGQPQLEGHFVEAARVLAVRVAERFGRPEAWLLAYQQPAYDSYGNWTGCYTARHSASTPSSTDSYHSARVLAAAWLAEQAAQPAQPAQN